MKRARSLEVLSQHRLAVEDKLSAPPTATQPSLSSAHCHTTLTCPAPSLPGLTFSLSAFSGVGSWLSI